MCIRDRYSAIVPVPPRVKKNRAENMPLLLAQRLGRILHIPVIQPLCLTRQVLPQKSLDQQKSFANVKDAYACRTGVDLSGMRLLLLDDVITTGATISALSLIHILKRALVRSNVAARAQF